MKPTSHFLVPTIVLAVIFAAGAAQARTIVLTDGDCDDIAAISADAPRMGWAGTANATAEFGTNAIDLYQRGAFLIRYPLDRIPKGQRITRAEWVVPFQIVHPPVGVRLQVRRVLKPWGAGVSHEFRMTRPEKLPWTVPGARGVGTDRAAQPTAVAHVKNNGTQSFNVTQDVELWYSGAAKNHGWMVTMDEADSYVRLASPLWSGPKEFKLRITFEPE